MNMGAIDLLLVLDYGVTITPPPSDLYNWIDNTGDKMITNTGDNIVFNAP